MGPPEAGRTPVVAPGRRAGRRPAWVARAIAAAVLAWLPGAAPFFPTATVVHAAPPVMVHVVPWYTSKPFSGQWGWHWTMGRFDPDAPAAAGQLSCAAHDPPLVGLYDSRDPALVECQVQLMKLAGIDGAVIDWYGNDPVHDYHAIHEGAGLLIETLARAGLRFVVCYEDQAAAEVAKARPGDGDAVAVCQRHLAWLAAHWCSAPGCLRADGRPVVLLFGPRKLLAAADWQRARAGLTPAPFLLGLPHVWREAGLDGTFGWPPVSGNREIPPAEYGAALERLAADARRGVPTVAGAFPGFHDVYREAGLHDSYGSIDERGGLTLAETLDVALATPALLVQIATWNDHGEGTAIEPTRDRGTARLRQVATRLLGDAAPGADDFTLPLRLYRLRRSSPPPSSAAATSLDAAADHLLRGRIPAARTIIVEEEAAAARAVGKR